MLSPVLQRLFRVVRASLVILAVASCAGAAYILIRLPAVPADGGGGSGDDAAEPVWPAAAVLPKDGWHLFQRSGGASSAPAGPLAGRFRLAGTFFVFSDATTDTADDRRRAIVDDMAKGEQRLVGEGQQLDEFEIIRVYTDRIALRAGGMDYELGLSFAGDPAPVAASGAAAADTQADEPEQALETNRFGKRVGFNRWVYSRDALMGYYRGLLDDPERIASLYLSLKPDYKEEDIAGYRLDPEGEEQFFKDIGLMPGDVIRKVNSMNMTSQKRAEYFMGEFVKNRLNAFVFDIEREGKPEKLIYLTR